MCIAPRMPDIPPPPPPPKAPPPPAPVAKSVKTPTVAKRKNQKKTGASALTIRRSAPTINTGSMGSGANVY